MSIGLDLGATQFRSLRYHGQRLIGRTCRAEVLSVPDTPAHRHLLKRDGARFAECDGELLIPGDAAREWGRLLSLPVRELLVDGQLPHADDAGRQLLALMVDAILPVGRQPEAICCLTIPGELLPVDESPEREFFLQLVRRRGYRPLVTGQGHAVALAEMGDSGFSGLGISLGATQCEFSLNCSSREVARCSIPWGIHDLDGLPVPLESLTEEPDRTTRLMLTDFLVELLLEAGARIGQNDGFRILTQPVAITCSGRITGLPGFAGVLQQAWQRAAWPVDVRSVSLGADPVYTVARGCLIRAALEAQVQAVGVAA